MQRPSEVQAIQADLRHVEKINLTRAEWAKKRGERMSQEVLGVWSWRVLYIIMSTLSFVQRKVRILNKWRFEAEKWHDLTSFNKNALAVFSENEVKARQEEKQGTGLQIVAVIQVRDAMHWTRIVSKWVVRCGETLDIFWSYSWWSIYITRNGISESQVWPQQPVKWDFHLLRW